MTERARLRSVYNRAKRRTRDATNAVYKALNEHGPDTPELEDAGKELRQARRAQQSAWNDIQASYYRTRTKENTK